MNKKFMRVERIVLSTLTVTIIASQLMSCSVVSRNELLAMINAGDTIEIEVAVPTFLEQGERQEITWEQLDSITNYKDFRKAFEDIIKVTPFGTNSKNGIVYVDLEGKQEGNNTLYNAFMNRKFISNYWEDEEAQKKIGEEVLKIYSDVDANDGDSKRYSAINAYWNLIPDSIPNYFNGGSTLTRGEAMALVMRAENTVDEDRKPDGDSRFTEAVGINEYTDYASYLEGDSYLSISTKSLNNQTFNSVITRGEYIYLLMNHYFKDRLAGVDIVGKELRDCKDGGDIAREQKFVENGAGKDYWESYELVYAIQNPDKGVSTKLYTSLVLANDLGIIGAETRWDEGLTKEEGIGLLCSVYEAYTKQNGYKTDAVMGIGERVEIEEATEEENKDDAEDSTKESTNSTSDTVISEEEYQKIDELAGQEGEVTTDEDLIDLNDLKPEDWGFSTQDELDAWISEMVDDVVGDSSSGGSTGGTSKDIPQAAKDMYHGVDDGTTEGWVFNPNDTEGLSTTGISY